MQLTVKTNINQQVSKALGDDIILNNAFSGSDISDDGFVVKNVDVKQFSFDTTSGPLFSIDLFDYIQSPPEDISFLHIYCFNSTVSSTSVECPIPVRFDISISDGTNTIVLGSMSQYEMANLDTFPAAGEVSISNVDISDADNTAALIIIIGSK